MGLCMHTAPTHHDFVDHFAEEGPKAKRCCINGRVSSVINCMYSLDDMKQVAFATYDPTKHQIVDETVSASYGC